MLVAAGSGCRMERRTGAIKQANPLLDSHAHRELRKVLDALRSQQKVELKLAELFPHLVGYFAK
jgi:hypothetical protein